MSRSRRRTAVLFFVFALAVSAALAGGNVAPASASPAKATPPTASHIDCSNGNRSLCTEVFDSEAIFGQNHYVGHDEPSTLFYSNTPGSGNQMQYRGTLPTEPAVSNIPGKNNYDFQYYAAIWFGMAMCDTQSYPEQVSTCAPDSNSNIVDPTKSRNHPGTAYMELQFYAPGYVNQWNGFTCSATQWCVSLTIDSLSENPVTGQLLNSTCAATTGVEYVNFAYLTKSGKPQGPPNPDQLRPAGLRHSQPQRGPVPEPGRLVQRVAARHGARPADDSPRRHDRPVRLDDRERGQRLRSGEVRAQPVHHVPEHPLRLPSDVLDVQHPDHRALGSGDLQRRL